MKRALVTGGSGFLGRHLVNALLKNGWSVRALIRSSNLRGEGFDTPIEYHKGDLAQQETLAGAVDGIDVVFHLAAQLGEWRVSEETFQAVNIRGTKHLLELCYHRDGIRFVFASTPGVQGKGYRRANEEMPYNPPHPYEKSKCQSEKLVLGAHKSHGLWVTVIRPDFVYGPGDVRRIPLYRAIQNHKFLIIGNGRSVLHPTYVSDVVQGFMVAATHPKANGEVFNIAGPDLISVNDYVNSIARALNVKPPPFKIPKWLGDIAALGCEALSKCTHQAPFVSKSKIDFLTQDHGCDTGKAQHILNFTPRIDFDTGIRSTVDWARNQGLL